LPGSSPFFFAIAIPAWIVVRAFSIRNILLRSYCTISDSSPIGQLEEPAACEEIGASCERNRVCIYRNAKAKVEEFQLPSRAPAKWQFD
jgi:hypothetical protein